MMVALARFDLRIPGCGSLKEKRHVVKTLTNAIRSKFQRRRVRGVQDLWQHRRSAWRRSRGKYHARNVLHEVERLVERWAEVEMIGSDDHVHYRRTRAVTGAGGRRIRVSRSSARSSPRRSRS